MQESSPQMIQIKTEKEFDETKVSWDVFSSKSYTQRKRKTIINKGRKKRTPEPTHQWQKKKTQKKESKAETKSTFVKCVCVFG